MKALPADTVPAWFTYRFTIVNDITGHRETMPLAAATLDDASRKAVELLPAGYRLDITIVQH